MTSTFRRTVSACALAVSLTAVAGQVASATPGSGVSAKELFKHTRGGTDYVGREITIQPGGTTGWHFHNGNLYAVVTSGVLTHYDSDCAVDGVYPGGAFIFEPAGADKVHIGRNLGAQPVVLEVLYVLPKGSALAEDAAAPECAA